MNVPDNIKKITEIVWEIPTSHKEGMRVPARIYATEKLLHEMDTGVFDQVTNVATLPGIQKYALCMPDGHWGYGFPIGGVAAMSADTGVISPGGIGFDVNCGMRLVVTNLQYEEVKPYLRQLVDHLFERVPAGVGSKGFIRISKDAFREVIEQGARWCLRNDYAWEDDLQYTEEHGCIHGADATKVSDKAIDRGYRQIGTLGSGNHYLELQVAKSENIQMIELAGGCVCCELRGEFEAALSELLNIVAPEFIILEATGIAESDALVYEVEDNVPEVRLDSVICIVDAFSSLKFPQVGYVGRRQLEAADIVIVNKIDLVSRPDIAKVEEQVRQFNQTPAVFHTVRCQIDTDLLFGIERGAALGAAGPTIGQSAGGGRIQHSARRHDSEIQSFTHTTDRPFDETRFGEFIENLPGSVLRAKGFVKMEIKGYLFNYVAGRFDLEEFDADCTQLVFIGHRLNDIKEAVLEGLRSCEV